MILDPIVEEIRRIRVEYARNFNYDLDAICQDLREKQSMGKQRVVSLPSKRPRERNRGQQAR